MKRKPRWEKQTFTLKDSHAWKAPPGYNIFAADRGAVRFNFPHGWVVVPASDCIEIDDTQPPDDDCRLAVSYLRLPPMDWSGLPLAQLIAAAIEGDHRQLLSRGEIVHAPRTDGEVAWTETRFIDSHEQREACSRLAIARGSNLQALITFDFWVDDTPRLNPVWGEVMRSVELGRNVDDPTRGDVLH